MSFCLTVLMVHYSALLYPMTRGQMWVYLSKDEVQEPLQAELGGCEYAETSQTLNNLH